MRKVLYSKNTLTTITAISQLTKEVLHNSYNTDTCGLPDMHTQSQIAEGVHTSDIDVIITT